MPNDLLSAHYEAIQARYSIHENEAFATLVVPNGNCTSPYHRWFHLKEGFSSQLLLRIIEEASLSSARALTLLDPFAGSGTTIASGLLWGSSKGRLVTACGFERNPFLHFVAQTKVNALTDGAPSFDKFVVRLLEIIKNKTVPPSPTPALSTFFNTLYFEPDVLRTLLEIHSAIVQAKGTAIERDLALLCLAGTVEPASRLRRDGRALRYESSKMRVNPMEEFTRRCRVIIDDLAKCHGSGKGHVYYGDGRSVQSELPDSFSADLVLFSPPYPNNIDYTEVYKLEAWLLGFISDKSQFRNLRLQTLRSHPSCMFPEVYEASSNGLKAQFDEVIAPLLDSVPDNKDFLCRKRLIRGYFDDMLRTLQNLRSFVNSKGKVVYVVGNSLHGSKDHTFLIAADLLIARLAEIVGYEIEQIVVARRPKRRSSVPLLRESIVFLRLR